MGGIRQGRGKFMQTTSSFRSYQFLLFSVLLGVMGHSSSSLAHPGNPRVDINIVGSEVVTAGCVEINFELFDKKENKMLSDQDLLVAHEKVLHFFFFDPALNEFRHEHPTYIGGKWNVSTELKVNSVYWIWVQGKVKSDGEEFTGSGRLTVQGGIPANQVTALGDVRVGTDGLSQAKIEAGTIKAGALQMLMINFSRTDGTLPNIIPYLGAKAHIVVTSSDGDSLIHVHPMDGSNPNQLMAHLTFAEAGEYRLWIQYLDSKVLKTIALSVVVTE